MPAGPDAILELLRRCHGLKADDLGRVVREVAEKAGLLDAVVMLADLDQRVLTPLPPAPGEPIGIDGSLPGRAYRSRSTTTAPAEGGTRLWMPVLDGTQRMGVLGVTVAHLTPEDVEIAERMSSLVALVVLSKLGVGDHLEHVRRVRPVTVAAELRWAMLPSLDFETAEVAVSAALQPAYEVAGDTLDYALNADRLHVGVFDAVGHTLTSSRVANLAVVAYRWSRRAGLDLAETVRVIDRTLLEEVDEEAYATALLMELDVRTGDLSWVVAGHPSGLRLRAGTVVEIDGPRFPPLGLGLGGDDVPVNRSTLEPGDRVVLYTDGVVDAQRPDGEPFGVERLIDHLVRAELSGEVPAETLRRLSHTIVDEAPRLRDDFTLVYVAWRGPAADPVIP